MKKEYQRPTAQKVSFAYDRVTAASTCQWYWTRTIEGKGCQSMSPAHSMSVALLALDCHEEGGYWVSPSD